MVSQRPAHWIKTCPAKVTKKPFWLADTRQRMHALTSPALGCALQIDALLPVQTHASLGTHTEAKHSRMGNGWRAVRAIECDGINQQGIEERLTQGPRRQYPPIAGAPPIEDCDLEVSRQPGVLQSVIAEHDRAVMLRQQQVQRRAAVVSDGQGQAGHSGKKSGFVTESLCRISGHRAGHEMSAVSGVPTPMTACQKPHAPASLGQGLRRGNHQRRLAGAPHQQIANDHDPGLWMGWAGDLAPGNAVTISLGDPTDQPGSGAQQGSEQPRKAIRRCEPQVLER